MGYMIVFEPKDKDLFELAWRIYLLKSVPNKDTRRTALAVEDKLLDVSQSVTDDVEIRCGNCKVKSPLEAWDKYNWWRIAEPRTLKVVEDKLQQAVIFFEDAEFNWFRSVMNNNDGMPQPQVRVWLGLDTKLEMVFKDWKGNEPELRARLIESSEVCLKEG